MKIGVGITTYYRDDVSEYSIAQWEKYLPKNAHLVVVKDIEGVARAKNICLKELEKLGVTHYFVADEDCYPIAHNWHVPYMESGENHLLYQFRLPSKPPDDMKELYRDDILVNYAHTRGAMIYLTQKVLDTVGGFDEAYDFGYEHPDLTNRIFNAGLTTHRAADVVGSEKLFYCLDQDGTVESSVSPKRRAVNKRKDAARYQRSKTSKEYKAYK